MPTASGCSGFASVAATKRCCRRTAARTPRRGDSKTTTAFTNGVSAPPGLPSTVTSAGGAVQTTSYFPNGDIASTTDPDGLVIQYTYDNLGRPLTKKVVSDTYSSGLTTSLTFDKLNRLTTETDPAFTNAVTGAVHQKKTTTVYDADGNVTSQQVQDLTGGDASRTVSATFNNHDQQVTSRTRRSTRPGTRPTLSTTPTGICRPRR